MSDEDKTCMDSQKMIDGNNDDSYLTGMKEWFSHLVETGKISQRPANWDMVSARMYIAHLESKGLDLTSELETYKQEYRLAAAANKQLADALDRVCEENRMLRLQIFAFVRNAAVLPIGIKLHKSEREITDKTFETIAAAKAMLNVEGVKALMNLATDENNRYDRD